MPNKDLSAEYFERKNRSRGASALSEYLALDGLDENLNPLAQGVEKQPLAQSDTSADARRQALERAATYKQQALNPPEGQPSFMGDVVGGTVDELKRGIIGGAVDAGREMLEAADDLAGWFAEKTGTQKGGGFKQLAEKLPTIEENKTTGGNLVRGFTQFLTAFVPAGKIVKGLGIAGKVSKPAIAGLLADIAAFDPDDPNISTALNQLAPELRNPITDFLATDPGDSSASNRFKRALEGLGLGVATDAIFHAVRMMRAGKAGAGIDKQLTQAIESPPPGTPAAATAAEVAPDIAPTGGAGRVDIVRQADDRFTDIQLPGKGGVVQTERLALPAPGQATQTADEIAENLVRERKARAFVEGNPTLAAAEEAVTIRNEVAGNKTLRAAYETTLKGESEEALIDELVKKAKPELSAIIKSQKGEISQAAMFATARAAAGAAIGLTQGDTLEERLGNALVGAGAGAALSPRLLKGLVGAIERVSPKLTRTIRSFDLTAKTETIKKLSQAQIKALRATVEFATPGKTKEFLEANPTGTVKVGTTDLKINWENIGNHQELNDVVDKIAQTIPKEIDAARRGVITREISEELARRFGIRDDYFLGLKPGDIVNQEQARALIATTGDAVRKTQELLTAYKAGQPVTAQLQAQFGKTAALSARMFGVRAESGRLQQVWGQTAKDDIERLARFNTDFASLSIAGKDISEIPIEKIAHMLGQLEGEHQIVPFMAGVQKYGRAVLEYFINGLLSNPVTHATNTVSNSATLAVGIMERQLAGIFGKEVARGEAAQMIHAVTGNFSDAMAIAKKAFATGESQFANIAGKVEVRGKAISAEALGITGPFGEAMDFIGHVIGTPSRALMAADDFFKALNYRAELRAQAFRQAATQEGLAGEALAKRLDELIGDQNFQAMVKPQAAEFAAYQTFNKQLGNFGNGFIKLLDDHPAARILFPFVRTPVNIAKYTLEHIPGLALLSKQAKADLAVGGARAELAKAKMAIGGLFMFSAGSLALSGRISGGGPADLDLKSIKMASGWQPYSIKVGDTWVSYKRLDPIGFLVGMAADIVEKGGELSEVDVGTLSMATVLAFKDTFVDKTYLQGVSDFWDAMQQPDRKLESYLRKTAGGFVPFSAGMGQIARMLDPTIKKLDSYKDGIFARLPGFSKDVPARRNIWGDKIILEGAVGPDIVSPFYSSTDKQDLATDEILRLGMSLSNPPEHIYGLRPSNNIFKDYDPRWGVKLLPEEYSRFQELAGNALKDGDGMGLHDRLNETIKGDEYKRELNDFQRKTLIQKHFTAFRQAAQAKLLEEFPDLKQSVIERMQERDLAGLAAPEVIQ